VTLISLIGLLALAGCGEDDETPSGATEAGTTVAGESEPAGGEAEEASEKTQPDDEAPEKEGTTVVLAASEFGDMLFDKEDQAIYAFENDAKNKTNCYGECAVAWPPVLTKGAPVAGRGVDGELLGTTKRRDGSTQVTYGGRPLYFYANEAPGEVRCHNVDLNGGLWWVVGRDGEPLP
jgi:predicted lipoprotein with Yx(FWY)xxD motif